MKKIILTILLLLAIGCGKDKPTASDNNYIVSVHNLTNGRQVRFFFDGRLHNVASGQYKSIGQYSGKCTYRAEKIDIEDGIQFIRLISSGNIVIDRDRACLVYNSRIEW